MILSSHRCESCGQRARVRLADQTTWCWRCVLRDRMHAAHRLNTEKLP